MQKAIVYTDGGARGNHQAPLETYGVPTLALLAAFLHGETIVSPTPFNARD